MELDRSIALTIYTFSKPNIQNQLNVVYISGQGVIKAIILALYFLKNQLFRRYDLIQAFWGFPSGKITVILGNIFSLLSVVTLMGGETAALPQVNYGVLSNKKGIKKVAVLLDQPSAVIAISECQIDHLRLYGISSNSDYR